MQILNRYHKKEEYSKHFIKFNIYYHNTIKIMSLNELIATYAARGNANINYNATVKDQIQNIENNLDNFRNALDLQKKNQVDIQTNLKKLEQQSKTTLHDLYKEVSERISNLTERLKSDSRTQAKQFQYLELQNSTLSKQHDNLNEFASAVFGRTEKVQSNVGV